MIFYKRMEQGRISHTVFRESESSMFKQLRWDELVLLVEGIPGCVKRRKRFNISNKI